MGQRTIIIHPTLRRAIQNWSQLYKKYRPLIRKVNHNSLSVEFINGDIWYFRADTEGAKTSRGYIAEIVSIDDFPIDKKIGEVFVKEQDKDGKDTGHGKND